MRKTFAGRMATCIILLILNCSLGAQNYEAKSIAYNTLLGGVSSGIGSLINRGSLKPGAAFLKGFKVGLFGGGAMYAGKKLNMLVAKNQQLAYAWLSRTVFTAGNSVVENGAANRPWWSRWHYDLGFIRLEYFVTERKVKPRIMICSLGAFAFTAIHGRVDARTSFRSGTLTFRTKEIAYAPYLVGSTTGNNFVLVDTLISGIHFHDIFAHEMVHTFQFQELSGMNYFFTPLTNRWDARSKTFTKINEWIYGDVNYPLMLGNYFLVQGGVKRSLYCKNFLENEAEVLTTGRVSCP